MVTVLLYVPATCAAAGVTWAPRKTQRPPVPFRLAFVAVVDGVKETPPLALFAVLCTPVQLAIGRVLAPEASVVGSVNESATSAPANPATPNAPAPTSAGATVLATPG